MAKTHNNRDGKPSGYRFSLTDDKTHEQLYAFHFTKVGLIVTVFSILVVMCVTIYSTIAYTPLRTFIPGYPDAQTKRAAIQNAIRIDSLENIIYKWELYSESLKRVMEGDSPLKLDSMINANNAKAQITTDASKFQHKDSLLRQHVREEEQFGISDRDHRDLPIEGMLFFTPLKGVVSQGYDKAVHPYVDITAPAGSVVKATLDGTVIYAGWSEDSGYTIHIQHAGDIVSIYKHNEKLLKKTGDKVTAGAPIALVGNTGSLSTGVHLHFELWHKGETINPVRYINF